MANPAMSGETTSREFDELIDTLADLPKPLIVAINGVGVGFGMTILGFADIVFMSSEARLRCPFTTIGAPPEAASTYLLPLLLGRQNAAWDCSPRSGFRQTRLARSGSCGRCAHPRSCTPSHSITPNDLPTSRPKC
jgi:enoyl-CoA hydratase/carnithine racemase